MRGRFQALLVVVAGAGSVLFCWISAAILVLVTLRKGAGAGAWLLMWALLPAGVLLVAFGDSGPLALLCGAMALALVLRATVSLPYALLATLPVGALTGLSLIVFGEAYLDQIVVFFAEFLGNLEQQLTSGSDEAVVLARPTALQVAGMLAAGNAMSAALCLLLGRYWQALLYNPGGFGEEFKSLHYLPALTTGLALGAMALAALGSEWRTWAMICAVPLNFAGLALVHARAKWRGQGTGWLVGFYLAWVFFDPVKLLVVFAAIADSWFNFRQHWVTPKGSSQVEKREQDEDQN